MSITQTPEYIDWFVPKLDVKDFNQAIVNHGNDCIIEKNIPCPCTSRHVNVPSSRCINCHGSGYIFLSKTSTTALIQGLNKNTKYEQWSETNTGISRITLNYKDKITIGDRITLTQVVEVFVEKLSCYLDFDGKLKANTIYDIINVEYLCLFVGNAEPVIYLTTDQYSIVNNIITFSDSISESINRDTVQDVVLSIRYTHRPQYIVFDSPRSNMVNKDIINCDQNIGEQLFPVSVMARIKHYQYSR